MQTMLPNRKQQIDIHNKEQFSPDQQERFTPKELHEQMRKLKSLQRKRESSFRNALDGSIGGSNGGNGSGGDTYERKQRLYLENCDKTPEEGEDDSSEIGFAVWTKVDEIIKRIKFKKYIKKLMFLSETRLWRLITPRQGKIINDQSYYFFPKKSTNEKIPFNCACQTSLFRMITKFKRKLAKFPVFLPHRFFLEFWQAMKLISFITCYFCYLVCFAFGISLEDTFNYSGLMSCQILLTVDILITLNTGIYLKGVLCINRKSILENYKQSRALYYDLGSCISVLAYYIQHTSSRTTRWGLALLLPIMLKQNDINFLIKKVKDIFLLDKKMQNVIELVNLLKNILLISHVFACIWIYTAKASESLQFQEYLATSSTEGGHTWISLVNLQTESWGIQYLYSYYFITVTMLTVGYGDIRPVNPVETAVCIVLMMICCLIFGFTINQIGEIFQDFYSEETKIRQKRCVIGNYMKRKDISSKTKKSIYEYLEYYWKEQIDESMEEEKRIVNQLSDNLKELLFQESNKIILKQSRVFRDNFSPDLIMKCLPIIIEQNCTPGEILIDSSIGNTECSIFFVQQGELDVSHISTNASFPGIREDNVVRKISKGGSFGERQFFTGETSSMGVRSNGFSKLLKIKRSDFISIVRPIAAEYESFCMVKDRALFSNDVQPLYLNCSACNENSHDETYCPVTHFTARKDKIIGKGHISFPIEERNQLFKRGRNERSSALGSIIDNFELLKVFMQIYSREIENHLDAFSQFSCFDQGIPSYQPTSEEEDNDEEDYLNEEEEQLQQSKVKKEFVFINTTNYNTKATDPNTQSEQNDNMSESSIGKQITTNILNNNNNSIPLANKNVFAADLNQQTEKMEDNNNNNEFKTAGAEDISQKEELPLILLSAKNNQHKKQENSQNGSKEDLNISKIKDDNSQLSVRRDSKIFNSPSRHPKNQINLHSNTTNIKSNTTNQRGNLTKDVCKSIRTKVTGMVGNSHKPSLNQLVKKINASKHLTFQSPSADKRLVTSQEAQNLFLASIFSGLQNNQNNNKKQFSNLQTMGKSMLPHRSGIIPGSSTLIQPQILTQGKTLAQSTTIWNSEMLLFDIFLGEFESLHNFKNYFPKYNLKNILSSKGMKDKTSKKENGQFNKNQRIPDRRLGQRKNTLRAAFRNKGKGSLSVSSQRSPLPSNMDCSIVQQSKFKIQKDTIFKTEEGKNKAGTSMASSVHPHSNKTIQISTQNINNNNNEVMTKSLGSNSRSYPMIDNILGMHHNIDDLNKDNQKQNNKIISEYNLNSSVRRILDNSMSMDAQSIADVPEELIIIRKDPSLSTFQKTCQHFKTADIVYQHPSFAETRHNTGFDSNKQL